MNSKYPLATSSALFIGRFLHHHEYLWTFPAVCKLYNSFREFYNNTIYHFTQLRIIKNIKYSPKMEENQNVKLLQKTTAKYPVEKDQSAENKTNPSKSKKMDRSLDDDPNDYIVPVHRNHLSDNDKDIDDIVVREDNFDEDILASHSEHPSTEDESNEDM
jgi:hypothetical protein